MSGFLLPVLLLACRATGPDTSTSDTHSPDSTAADTQTDSDSDSDTGDTSDTGPSDDSDGETGVGGDTADSASDSADSGLDTADTGTDTADTAESPDTGDGTPVLDLDAGTTFDARIVGAEVEAPYGLYGATLALATGDTNGDGSMDILVGFPAARAGGSAAGASYLVLGPLTGTKSVGSADASVDGTAGQWLGHSLAAGDIDGDGLDDLLVGAPEWGTTDEYGAAYLFLGPVSGDLGKADADASAPTDSTENAGWALGISGDMDGDGTKEFALGSPPNHLSGGVYVYSGAARGALGVGDATAVITGDSADGMSDWIGPAGDQDGDGLDDLLVAQSYGSSRQLLLYHGPLTGSLTDADADAAFSGDPYFGSPAAVGDVNGDGYVDTVAAFSGDSSVAYNAGSAFLWYGPLGSDVDTTAADASVHGNLNRGRLGFSLATGDVDGDGNDELLVGEPELITPGPGSAYLFAGPLHGTIDLADAWVHFSGDGEDSAGFATALDDADGDGLDDVIIAAPWDDAGVTRGGTVWIQYATSI